MDLIVQFATPGKPTQASDAGKLTIDTGKLKLTERCGSVQWELRLEPGEAKTLTYEYQRYVPSN